MKKLLPYVLLPLIFLLQGCLDSDTPTCSEDDVKDLVHEIIDDDIREDLVLSYFKITYPDKVMQYTMLKSYEGVKSMMPQESQDKMKNADDIPEFIEAKALMQKQFETMELTLKSIRSTKIEDKLKKISCSATMNVKLPDFDIITYDLDYDAQITDDGEEIIVEVYELK